MRRIVWSVCGVMMCGLLLATPAGAQTAAAPAAAPAAEPGELEVTASYTGKGDVKADREISVFLFSDPNINETSMPLAMDVIEKNGGSVKFSGLPGPVVYVVLVYDHDGTYERTSAPAPGTPLYIHMGKDGTPEGVKVGKGAKVALTFDDSRRM